MDDDPKPPTQQPTQPYQVLPDQSSGRPFLRRRWLSRI